MSSVSVINCGLFIFKVTKVATAAEDTSLVHSFSHSYMKSSANFLLSLSPLLMLSQLRIPQHFFGECPIFSADEGVWYKCDSSLYPHRHLTACTTLLGNVHGSSMAYWKARCRLPISANWSFLPALTVKALWANIGRNCAVWNGVGHFERLNRDSWQKSLVSTNGPCAGLSWPSCQLLSAR